MLLSPAGKLPVVFVSIIKQRCLFSKMGKKEKSHHLLINWNAVKQTCLKAYKHSQNFYYSKLWRQCFPCTANKDQLQMSVISLIGCSVAIHLLFKCCFHLLHDHECTSVSFCRAAHCFGRPHKRAQAVNACVTDSNCELRSFPWRPAFWQPLKSGM